MYEKINSMVERQKENYRWEFIFLGANIDALETAERFGIHRDRAANYHSDSKGTETNYKVVNEAISNHRINSELAANWKDEIDKDFIKRQK